MKIIEALRMRFGGASAMQATASTSNMFPMTFCGSSAKLPRCGPLLPRGNNFQSLHILTMGGNGTHRRFGGSLVPPCSWAIPQWNSTDFELRELISLTGESLPEGKCPDTPCSHNLHEKTCLKRAVGFSRILNSARSIGPCSPTFSCVYSPSFST